MCKTLFIQNDDYSTRIFLWSLNTELCYTMFLPKNILAIFHFLWGKRFLNHIFQFINIHLYDGSILDFEYSTESAVALCFLFYFDKDPCKSLLNFKQERQIMQHPSMMNQFYTLLKNCHKSLLFHTVKLDIKTNSSEKLKHILKSTFSNYCP